MAESSKTQKVLVVGAGPVGALAALYAAERGDNVHVYELRAGKDSCKPNLIQVQHQHPHFQFCSLAQGEISLVSLYLGKWTPNYNLSSKKIPGACIPSGGSFCKHGVLRFKLRTFQ